MSKFKYTIVEIRLQSTVTLASNNLSSYSITDWKKDTKYNITNIYLTFARHWHFHI